MGTIKIKLSDILDSYDIQEMIESEVGISIDNIELNSSVPEASVLITYEVNIVISEMDLKEIEKPKN